MSRAHDGSVHATTTPTERLLEAVRASGVLPSTGRILVAVSGGRDSTALAALLAAWGGLPLVLAHVDHGWRGPEAAALDRAGVEALATRLGAALVTAGPPPPDTPRTEAAARRFRYRALGALARAQGCATIATGHHAGDQAETVLMRLLRGSGTLGLAGIPAARPLAPGGLTVIRPLLGIEPAELETWLRRRAIPWHEDETNTDLRRDRAAIRARLAARPQARRSLVALAVRMERRIADRRAHIAAAAGDAYTLHARAQAVAMPRAPLQLWQGEDLALALRHAGARIEAARDGPWLTRALVRCAHEILLAGGGLDLPHGLHLHVRGHTAWLLRRDAPLPPVPTLEFEVVARRAFDLAAWQTCRHRDAVALDADELGPAPVVRPLDPAAAFAPLGSSGRLRPIGAWLAKQGVAGFVRRGLLTQDGAHGIAWLVGRRVDARHAITDATQRVALARIVNP